MTTVDIDRQFEEGDSVLTSQNNVWYRGADVDSISVRFSAVGTVVADWAEQHADEFSVFQYLVLSEPEPLNSETDPVLAQLWDNDEDDIFDLH